MPAFQSWEIKTGFGPVTMAAVPPVNAGGLPWGSAWLSFGCDFGSVQLRVAYHDDVAWHVQMLIVDSAQGRSAAVISLPSKTGKISVMRVARSPDDTGADVPVSMLIEYGFR